MPPKGGSGDKSDGFWKAIQSQKQDTIRWSFNYGGINTFTRDDDGAFVLPLAETLSFNAHVNPIFLWMQISVCTCNF